jgi:hypothetical protein
VADEVTEKTVTPVPGRFEFTITREPAYGQTYWSVELPHQCDAWEIGSAHDPAVVEATLEVFIAEANSALDQLRDIRKAQGSS